MKNFRGQVSIIFMLLLGAFLATLIVFGFLRFRDTTVLTYRLTDAQVANQVFTGAAKRIQQIYYNEAGCDPDILDTRIGSLPAMSSGTEMSTGVTWMIADPEGATDVAKYNASTSAARQIPIELAGRGYIVTVGRVSGEPRPGSIASTVQCPRDTTVQMKLTIRGKNFLRQATLLNICSYESCAGSNFDTVADMTTDSEPQTSACGDVKAKYYGDVAGTGDTVTVDDLLWIRRYLASGGADIGDTTFADFTSAPSAGENGACPATDTQCSELACWPPADLNRDEANTEADIAIMEYFQRGFIKNLPVRGF